MKRGWMILALILSGACAHAVDSADALNVRINPLGVLVGSISLNLDVAVLPRWTLGPEFKYWNLRTKSNDGNSYDVFALGGGVRANWFKEGVFTDGLYVGPSLSYARTALKVKNSAGELSYDDSSLILSSVVGYAWFWSSFNIHLGGGANVNLGNDNIQVKNTDGSTSRVRTSVTGLTAEFSLGYTF